MPCRNTLLRKLQELLRGKLALGLDLAKSSNDGLKHLVTAAHGRHRVTNGLDHIKHSAGGKAVSQELPGSLLQPDEPEGGPAGVDLQLPQEAIGPFSRPQQCLKGDLALLKVSG